MEVIAIIQARWNSERFPGKILADFDGKTILRRVIDATKASDVELTAVAVPSSDRKALCDAIWEAGVPCWSFPNNLADDDVLSRFVRGARLVMPKWIIRVCGDCPLLWTEGINRLIEATKTVGDHIEYIGWKYSNGTKAVTVPNGVFAEAVSYEALLRIDKDVPLNQKYQAYHREHVTSRLYEWAEEVASDNCLWLDVPDEWEFTQRYGLAIDTKDNLKCAVEWHKGDTAQRRERKPPDVLKLTVEGITKYVPTSREVEDTWSFIAKRSDMSEKLIENLKVGDTLETRLAFDGLVHVAE